MTMEILGTGLSGLVGSRVVELLSPQFQFVNVSRETGFDITDSQMMEHVIRDSHAPWVFHFAAFTDVQAAEQERTKGQESTSWKVNVEATENLADLCAKFNKRLLYISTDYVFDGTKDSYTEDDTPAPRSWYARTKYEGEKRVEKLGDGALIVRISNPYKAKPVGKYDFVHKIIDRLRDRQSVQAPTDQLFSPTFVDDLAHALQILIPKDASGIYHVGSSVPLSPYEAAYCIARIYELDVQVIEKTTYKAYFQSRAHAPKRAVLKHDKIDKLGVHLSSFEEGMKEVKKQETL